VMSYPLFSSIALLAVSSFTINFSIRFCWRPGARTAVKSRRRSPFDESFTSANFRVQTKFPAARVYSFSSVRSWEFVPNSLVNVKFHARNVVYTLPDYQI
jgi:hypothetical protein